jgi:hypothetical protein
MIANASLHQIQDLTAQRALEKGFSLGELADRKTLDFPFEAGLALCRLMAAVEAHRKSLDPYAVLNSAEAEALANASAAFGGERDLDRISVEKKYLIAKLVLIASECAEAIEAVLETGSDNPKTSQSMVAEELADVVIRSIGLGNELRQAFPGVPCDVAQAVVEKIDYNEKRPYKHGQKLY